MTNKNRELKKYVYSIRITKKQNNLLKNNKWIKEELDKYIREYLNGFLQE